LYLFIFTHIAQSETVGPSLITSGNGWIMALVHYRMCICPPHAVRIHYDLA